MTDRTVAVVAERTGSSEDEARAPGPAPPARSAGDARGRWPGRCRVWKRLAGTEYPAMAGIGVARPWDDDAVVEFQCFAVRDR